MPGMRIPVWVRWALPAIVIVGVVTAFVAWVRTDRAGSRLDPAAPVPGPRSPGDSASAVVEAAAGDMQPRLRSVAAALGNQSRDETRRVLAGLRRDLLALPAGEAGQAVSTFLDSKQDAQTGLGFVVGAGGTLTEAPTLRVFLLDLLGQLDPTLAAAQARAILSNLESPDEWALALRGVALADPSPEARALLEQKVGELLRHEPWQREPSSGYLEAFDVAVFVGGTNLIPALSDLVRRQDNPAVAHAAYLAVDRLVIDHAAQTLRVFQADLGLMRGREATRANYFARADVREAEQRQVLENYLLDPRIAASELDRFVGLYPNANYMISHNLLTHTPTPDGAALAARDVESLRVLHEWLADPRFAALRPRLERAKRRLEEFVRSADRAVRAPDATAEEQRPVPAGTAQVP